MSKRGSFIGCNTSSDTLTADRYPHTDRHNWKQRQSRFV